MKIMIQIFLFAILMIIGLGMLMSGIMVLSIGRPDGQVFGIGALIFGLLTGPTSLFMIIRLNRTFQDEELKKALANPESILLRFPAPEGKGEILITRTALFEGKKHYPFNGPFERLVNLSFDGQALTFSLEVSTVETVFRRDRTIAIPNKLLKEAAMVKEKLQEQYLALE